MRLGILSVVLLAAVIAAPQVVAAGLPFTPAGLGHMEGALNFCERAIPKSAAAYKEQKELLVQGVSHEALAKVRSASEYKQAYKAITERLENVPKDEVAEGCKVFLGR